MKGKAAIAIVESATRDTIIKPAEIPLTAEEISELRRQFQFLRDHRKQLKLKLNAQEDLLVNGAREPEHRGVCQHLLAKVDYSRVLAAAESLAPKERLALVEGVMRFSSELSFLLLYLECLKASGHAGATAALSHALSRIDFANVSEGQMRRVLELVVELFPSHERPKLLLSLLESKTFRAAFDGALQKLPPELQELVSPLRAVHGVIVRGRKNPGDASELRAGLRMLLSGESSGLDRRSSGFRERLLGCALMQLDGDELSTNRTIVELVSSFKTEKAQHLVWQERFVRALLQTGKGRAAKQQLRKLLELAPAHQKAQALDQLLEAPRLGGFALTRETDRLPFKSSAPLRPGICLTTQRPVWLRVAPNDNSKTKSETAATPADAQAQTPEAHSTNGFEERQASESNMLLPSVVSQYFSGKLEGRACVAYLRHGTNAHSVLKPPTSVGSACQATAELVLISAGLSALGFTLPDFDWSRFEMDSAGRLWLLERWDAEQDSNPRACEQNLERAKAQVLRLLDAIMAEPEWPSDGALGRAVSTELRTAVEAAASHCALLVALQCIEGPANREL